MSVRINIVGGGVNKPVEYPDGSNTEAVEKKLFGRFGQGGLEQNGVGVLSDTLASGDYEYHLTTQQGGGAKEDVLKTIVEKLDKLSDSNRKLSDSNRRMTEAVIATTRPKMQSGKTQRKYHQTQFKTDLINRYQCDVGAPANELRCMVLNIFVPSNQAVAGHIIGLREREQGTLELLGLSYEDVWDERNGLIWWHEIENAKENMEVTLLLDHVTQVFSLRVLYDDVLTRQLSIPRSALGLTGGGNLTFSDLEGRPLILPPLTFPFRRALYYMAYYAYETALKSKRPHNCASASSPDEEGWSSVKEASIEGSDCGECVFFHEDNDAPVTVDDD